MSKTTEKILLFGLDFLTINLTFLLWSKVRQLMHLYSETSFSGSMVLSLIVYGFWLILFLFFGLYRVFFTKSRVDEFIDVVKIVTIGVFIIFVITMDIQQDVSQPFKTSRLMIVTYWVMMVFIVGFGRILLRTIHRKLLEIGIGLRKTLIVGWGKRAYELFDWVTMSKAIGYQIVGFITPAENKRKGTYKGIPVKGKLDQLYRIIKKENIQDILIALPRHSEKKLEQVIAQCNGTQVGIKIVPDHYDIIIGQVRTNQIYGYPLIEILPQLMGPWERVIKRCGDIAMSFIMLIGFLPFWLLLTAVILIDSRGPVFYTQKRVGKDGKIFSVIKFRSMVQGAEKISGPVWASENDTRITRVGRFLRKCRLDEIPQMINVLKGDMALIGPRPERPYFVEQLKKHYPLYSRRLRVRPGITGWAQIKGDYDQSVEDVKQKLEYDLFYLENMSLRLDLKILINTAIVMLRGKGQ